VLVAVFAVLLLGPRATEFVVRDVRDLDDGGRMLVIPHGKTRRAERVLKIPKYCSHCSARSPPGARVGRRCFS
jgi:hypothetical protein